MSHGFKGYDLGNLLDDVPEAETATVISIEADIVDENAIGILTIQEERPISPLARAEDFTVYRKVGKSRVKTKARLVITESDRGVAGDELHQVYATLAPGATPTKGTPFDQKRHIVMPPLGAKPFRRSR